MSNIITDELIEWVAEIMRDQGPGEFIIHVTTSGSAMIKVPRRPIRYNYQPEGLRLQRDIRAQRP